jgi:predicted nucleotidyltransferase
MASFNDRVVAERIARKFAEFLKQNYNIDSVYLYGYYAKGNWFCSVYTS